MKSKAGTPDSSTRSCLFSFSSLVLILDINIISLQRNVWADRFFSLASFTVTRLRCLLPFLRIGCIWPGSQGQRSVLFSKDWREFMMNSNTNSFMTYLKQSSKSYSPFRWFSWLYHLSIVAVASQLSIVPRNLFCFFHWLFVNSLHFSMICVVVLLCQLCPLELITVCLACYLPWRIKVSIRSSAERKREGPEWEP